VSTPDRRIAEPEFPDDDGTASTSVAEALAAYDADPAGARTAALAALQDSRLLVPVVAQLGEVEHDEHGLAHDKTSDMAAVLITGRDGRTALLSFTSTVTMQTWNPGARPVAVNARQAARAALQDGADALVVDLAGPVLFSVEGDDLRDLAAGLELRRVAGPSGEHAWGWTTPLA
jgi:hypothetical protein